MIQRANRMSIERVNFNQFPLYFFDANVWIYYFTHTNKEKAPPIQRKYISLLEDVLEANTNGSENAPKILMPLILFSEILNRYMRDIAWNEFRREKGINTTKQSYKNEYKNDTTRGGKEHHDKMQKRFIDDMKQFNLLFTCIDDSCISSNLMESIGNIPTYLDMNDFVYNELCKKSGAVIVTNDTDFLHQDITSIVITASIYLTR